MSIFSAIKDAIFGGPANAAEATPAPGSTPPAGVGAAKPAAPAAGAGTPTTPAAAKTPVSKVDVAAVLDKLADESEEDFDWRKSIIDLMKLLDLDSSLKSRKALAQELKYTGDMKDSAAMNIWLHKQVMTKLAANGGKLPPDIKH